MERGNHIVLCKRNVQKKLQCWGAADKKNTIINRTENLTLTAIVVTTNEIQKTCELLSDIHSVRLFIGCKVGKDTDTIFLEQ